MAASARIASRVSAAMAIWGLLSAVVTVSTDDAAFHVPSTISDAAKEALKTFTGARLIVPEPDDLEGWIAFQAGVEEQARPVNERVLEEYGPTVREVVLGGVPALEVVPNDYKDSEKILIYLHGGGYSMLSANTTLTAAAPVAAETGLRVLSVDYTLAPEAKWMTVSEQIFTFIQAVVTEEGVPVEDMALFGDASGGAMVASVVVRMRDEGMGMPAAAVFWYPWADITETGDTYFTLRDQDPKLSYPRSLERFAKAYADPAYHRHPVVSPVYADYSKGFPPALIFAGTKDLFLSNAVRLARVLKDAGNTVELDVLEGMWPVFATDFPHLPESDLLRRNMAKFLEERMNQ